jgi:hypothetical protein
MEPPREGQRRPKSRRRGTEQLEPAGAIERSGVRVADHVQRCGATLSREGDGAFDQQSPDALPPRVRLDEETVELGVAAVARQDDGESDDRAVALGHEDMPADDLLERQSNRVRIRKQDVAIVWIGKRRAPLQRLERLLFRLDRTPDDDGRFSIQPSRSR